MTAPSSAPPHPRGPVEAAIHFVKAYDEWAQSGYAEPIPDALRSATTAEMFAVLEDDQNWYLTGGVQQHGDVRIVDSELNSVDDTHAVVRLSIDASAVTVTAEGEETFVDYSRVIVTRFFVERDGIWRIASTKTDF
jgi:predicted lipid-binding transport protein (Tim44 family)